MSHPIRMLAILAVSVGICGQATAGPPGYAPHHGRKVPVPFVHHGGLVRTMNGLSYRQSNTPHPPPGSVVFWNQRGPNGGLSRNAHVTMTVPGRGHFQMPGRYGADNRTEVLRPGQIPSANRGSYVRGTVFVPPPGANINWNRLPQLQGVPRVNSRTSNCFGAVDAGLRHLVTPRSAPRTRIQTHP